MVEDPAARSRQRSLSEWHLLSTYVCNYECDHCFVWGGPSRSGTMTVEGIENILGQAEALGSIEWIYFEGGEAFLYYPILCAGARRAKERGFKVGMVSNAYWASSDADAVEWLKPLAGLVDGLCVSSDAYHGGDEGIGHSEIARRVARRLGIPTEFISIAEPEAADESGAVLYRGRAAELLASRAKPTPWERLSECPWEELRDPKRIHVDPFGNLHICQGISIGNLLKRPLVELMADYAPDDHPIVGPLLVGGPAAIVRRYDLPHEDEYADHCHLCYKSRLALRKRFPDVLTPGQMYGTS